MSVLKKYAWFIIPVLFLLYSAPAALDYLFYFPDEKYYTDAVLQMMDKHDWLTPYKADGSPRFLKPILTYWVLLLSYSVLGISTLSSRLLFWIAGAFLIFVVYRMTLSLLKKKKAAILAAFITAANPLVLMSASRSIPDILLVLFLTVSAWGFLEMMLAEKPEKKHYWMAYLGAALAFQTKGLPAAAFAGVSFLFLLFNPWKSKKLNQLINPAAVIVSVLVALSWFIMMYFRHGSEYLNSFFADQIGYRVSSRTEQVFTNTFLGILNLLAFTLPWNLLLFLSSGNVKKHVASASAERKALLGFIALWVVMVVVMSGAVFRFYDRYLLPVIPLLSIFFGWIFSQNKIRFERPVLKIFIGIILFILLIGIFYAVFTFHDGFLISGTVAGMLLLLFVWRIEKKWDAAGIAIANAILLLWFNAHVLLYSLLMPHPARQLTETIKQELDSPHDKVYVYGNIRMASGIRVYSHHKLDVVSMDTIYTLPDDRQHLLVFDSREKHLLNLEEYHTIQGSEEWKTVPAENFPVFLQPFIKKLKNSGTVYYVAKPKET